MTEAEQYQQIEWPAKQEALVEFKKAIKAKGDFKKIALHPRVPDRAVGLNTETSLEEQAELMAFLDKTTVFLCGPAPTSLG
jgi:hypothetical protein